MAVAPNSTPNISNQQKYVRGRIDTIFFITSRSDSFVLKCTCGRAAAHIQVKINHQPSRKKGN